METKNNTIKNYIKQRKRSIPLRIFLMVAGIVLSSFGLATYQAPAVGASQIDWALYNALATFIEYGKDGAIITSDGFAKAYPYALWTIYAIFMVLALSFALKPTIQDYKKNKKAIIWVKYCLMLVGDILITVIVSFLISNFLKITSTWIQKTESGQILTPVGIRNTMFVGGFVCFVSGIGMWIKSGWLLGPFNNVCMQFIRLTKLSYPVGRMIIDISILISGFILFAFIKVPTIDGESVPKTTFLWTNFGLGTICHAFLVGPTVGVIIKGLNKIMNYDKIDKLTPKEEIKAEINQAQIETKNA